MTELETEQIPGSGDVTVNADGIIRQTYRGMADMETGSPMTKDTVLWMASTGKTVTAIAFMMLAEEGRAGLDDPVAEHLPYFKNLYRETRNEDHTGPIERVVTPVTIRQLPSARSMRLCSS